MTDKTEPGTRGARRASVDWWRMLADEMVGALRDEPHKTVVWPVIYSLVLAVWMGSCGHVFMDPQPRAKSDAVIAQGCPS